MKLGTDKKIEIFCGTGGVGKTTLATSRAIYLAQKKKRVLLITIDPSKRLKQLLGLDSHNQLEAQKVNLASLLGSDAQELNLYAQLMSPLAPLQRMSDKTNGELLKNPIINILSRPYGGMNEIMSVLELNYQMNTNKFDVIVLDTPPGQNFIDFLNAGSKIKSFFDSSFSEVFKYLGKKVSGVPTPPKAGFLGKIAGSGIKKLLSYLNKVTGESFVDQFVDAIALLFSHRSEFLDGIKFLSQIENPDFCHWFLVTSIEQKKIIEANGLLKATRNIVQQNSSLLINKCLAHELTQWSPIAKGELDQLRTSLLDRENRLRQFANSNFSHIVEFPEVFDRSPIEHVKILISHWE